MILLQQTIWGRWEGDSGPLGDPNPGHGGKKPEALLTLFFWGLFPGLFPGFFGLFLGPSRFGGLRGHRGWGLPWGLGLRVSPRPARPPAPFLPRGPAQARETQNKNPHGGQSDDFFMKQIPYIKRLAGDTRGCPRGSCQGFTRPFLPWLSWIFLVFWPFWPFWLPFSWLWWVWRPPGPGSGPGPLPSGAGAAGVSKAGGAGGAFSSLA